MLLLESNDEAPVTKSFDIDEARAESIFRNIEKSLVEDNICIHDILLEIFDSEELDIKEKMFSVYAAGFVGGRHSAVDEIASVVGFDRLSYLMDNHKNHTDCMYQ